MKLRLGPLPETGTVRMTFSVPASLKAQLDSYAEVYSANFGAQVDAQRLVPLMLASFLAKDRAFQRSRREKT